MLTGWVENKYGQRAIDCILNGAELGFYLGYADIIDKNPDDNEEGQLGTLRLKDPDGLLYSNYIISSIFAELDEIF